MEELNAVWLLTASCNMRRNFSSWQVAGSEKAKQMVFHVFTLTCETLSLMLLKLGFNGRLHKLVGKSTLLLMHVGKENFCLTREIWGENLLMARGIFCWSINIPVLRSLLLLVISWFLCPVKSRRIKPSWHCSRVLGLSHCDCFFMRQFWYLLKCWMLWQQEW